MIIVEKESLKTILSNSFLDNIDCIEKGNLIGREDELYKSKIKLIPFSSLGNENGILIGFKPDYIRILRDNESILKNVIVRNL